MLLKRFPKRKTLVKRYFSAIYIINSRLSFITLSLLLSQSSATLKVAATI